MNSPTTTVQIPKAATPEQPWPGLAAFEEGDFDFFKGRDAPISAIARLVIREDLTFLWGFSGLGKTSLLRAGLFPRLREADIFPVYVRLRYDAKDPPLVQQCFEAIEEAATRWGYEVPQRAEGDTLWKYARRRNRRFWSSKNRLVTPLLVFDQFEEIFENGRVRESKQVIDLFAQLSNALTGITANESLGEDEYLFKAGVFKVLLSFREDFVAQVAKCTPLVSGISHRYYRLESMTFEDAVNVVREGGGHLIENVDQAAHEGLCRQIVDHVANTTGEPGKRSSATVDPALLSLYCSQLNERRSSLKKKTIDATLLAAGEASNIIPAFYEACMREVSEHSRQVLEHDLVLHGSRTRNSIAEETLIEAGVKPAELEQLIGKRILRRDTTRQPRIEFTHDVLVNPAVEAFTRREAAQQRLEEEEKRLAEERQRATVFRWRVLVVLAILGLFAGVASWRALELSQEQTTRLLVQESQKQLGQDPPLSALFSSWAADAARGQSRELLTLATDALIRSVRAASTATAFAITGSAVAVNSAGTQAAVVSADGRAVHLLKPDAPSATQQRVSASDGKSVFAVKFFAKDTELLLLNTDASIDRVHLSDAPIQVGPMSTRTAGFERGAGNNPFGSSRRLIQWALTNDGKVVVLSATSIDYTKQRPVDYATLPRSAAVSPPAARERYWLSVADIRADLFTREVSSPSVSDVVLASSGLRYAVIENRETVTIRDVYGETVARRSFPPSEFVFSADGALVLAMPRKLNSPAARETPRETPREITVWNVGRADASRVTLPGRDEIVNSAFSPDGAVFAVVQAPGVAQFWNTTTLKPIFPAPLSATSVRFSSDSHSVLTWDTGSTAQLRRLDGDDRAVGTLGGQEGIVDVAFAAGSDRIAMLTAAGLRVWSAKPAANPVDTVIATRATGLSVMAVAPDGKELTVGGDNNTLAVSLADGVVRPTIGAGRRVTALGYSADSSNLAVAITTSKSADASTSASRVVVRGARSGANASLDVPSGRVTSMAFAGPDLLVYLVETSDFAGRVEVADLQSGRVVQRTCFSGRVAGLSADERTRRFGYGVFASGYGIAPNSSGFSFHTADARGPAGGNGNRESRCEDTTAPPSALGSQPPSPVAPVSPPPGSAVSRPPPLAMPPPSSSAAPPQGVGGGSQLLLPISVISRDLKRAISRNADNEVNLWLTLDRPEATVTLGETVRAITITDDGRRFAAGGEKGLVKVFDAERWTDPITLQTSGAPVEAMAFTDDGGELAVLYADGKVTLYPLSADALVKKAREITKGRVPTSVECQFLGGWCGSDATSFGSMLWRMLPARRPR